MGQEPLYDTPEFRALMVALEEEWPQRQTALHASGVPLNDEDDGDGDGDGDGDAGDAGDGGSGEGDGGQTFDAAYVKRLREENAKHRREKQELAGRLQAHEDANKTELERAQEAASSAAERATAAEQAALRLEVALEKAPEGMPIAQVRKLAKRLAGATQEELEADAEELFADFTPDPGQESGTGRRPKERLRPGAAPESSDDDEETDPAKLAAMVRRPY